MNIQTLGRHRLKVAAPCVRTNLKAEVTIVDKWGEGISAYLDEAGRDQLVRVLQGLNFGGAAKA